MDSVSEINALNFTELKQRSLTYYRLAMAFRFLKVAISDS